MKAYSVVLTLLIGVIVALLVTRTDVETTVLRNPGTLFQKQDDGRISNLYQFKVVNKTSRAMPIHFVLLDAKGEVKLVGKELDLEKAQLMEGEMFIILDPGQMSGYNTEVTVGVFTGEKLLEKVRTSFIGPMAKRS